MASERAAGLWSVGAEGANLRLLASQPCPRQGSLRVKTLLVSAVLGETVLVVMYLVIRSLLLGNFTALEDAYTSEQLQRLQAAIDTDLEGLASTAHDYAAWDDTWEFVVNPNREYIESNLPQETFDNIHLDAMVFLNTANRPVRRYTRKGRGDYFSARLCDALLQN